VFANGVLNQFGFNTNYGKAIIGVLVAFVGALTTAVTVGDLNLGDLSAKDWAYAAGAALASGAMVWLVSNIPGVLGSAAKAIWSAATAGIASYILAASEGSALGENISQGEWLGIISTAIVASGLVYQEKGPDPSP
jgi:hypothetical protein